MLRGPVPLKRVRPGSGPLGGPAKTIPAGCGGSGIRHKVRRNSLIWLQFAFKA